MKPTYEELEQQLAAVVAENAGLKKACGGDGSYRDCPACTHSEYIEAPDTLATDAALAEVRAQAVEILNTQFKKCTGMLYAESVVSTVEAFAAQLRKGVQS